MDVVGRLASKISPTRFAKLIQYVSQEDLPLEMDCFDDALREKCKVEDLFMTFIYLRLKTMQSLGQLRYCYDDECEFLSDSMNGVVNWTKSISRDTLSQDMLYVRRRILTLHSELHRVICIALYASMRASSHPELESKAIEFVKETFKFDLGGSLVAVMKSLNYRPDMVMRYIEYIDRIRNSGFYLDYNSVLVICRYILEAVLRLDGNIESLSIDSSLEHIVEKFVVTGIRRELRSRFSGRRVPLAKGAEWHLADSDRQVYSGKGDAVVGPLWADGLIRIREKEKVPFDIYILEVKTNFDLNKSLKENIRQLNQYALYLSPTRGTLRHGVQFSVLFDEDYSQLEPMHKAVSTPERLNVPFSCFILDIVDDDIDGLAPKFKEFCDWLGILDNRKQAG